MNASWKDRFDALRQRLLLAAAMVAYACGSLRRSAPALSTTPAPPSARTARPPRLVRSNAAFDATPPRGRLRLVACASEDAARASIDTPAAQDRAVR